MDGCEVLEVPLTAVIFASWDESCCCVEIRVYDNLHSVLGCVNISYRFLSQMGILPHHHALQFRVTVLKGAALAARTPTLASKYM